MKRSPSIDANLVNRNQVPNQLWGEDPDQVIRIIKGSVLWSADTKPGELLIQFRIIKQDAISPLIFYEYAYRP